MAVSKTARLAALPASNMQMAMCLRIRSPLVCLKGLVGSHSITERYHSHQGINISVYVIHLSSPASSVYFKTQRPFLDDQSRDNGWS